MLNRISQCRGLCAPVVPGFNDLSEASITSIAREARSRGDAGGEDEQGASIASTLNTARGKSH